jgi:hypothetical protein
MPDEITSMPETSVASTEPVVSPTTMPASATGSEAVNPTGTTTGQPLAQPEPKVGETVAVPSEELPDDQAFQQLPGEQRASNWSKARARIGELNQRVEQLSQLEPFQPVAQSLDEMGGWETVEPRLQLANQLFSPATDEQGNAIVDNFGYPVYTPAPFVNSLAAESPQMLADIIWNAWEAPISGSGETYGNWLLRNIGLDPSLIETYKQIQSPDQARQHIVASGAIDPAVYEGIKPEYHDALKSLLTTRPGLRAEWDLIGDDAKQELLEERKTNLEAQAFIQDRKSRDQQEDQQRQQGARERIEQAGNQLVDDAQQKTVNAQYERLQQTATFFSDAADNQVVWNNIIQSAAQKLETDPKLGADSVRASDLYKLSAQYEAYGDRFRAREARVQADRLAIKLSKAFGDAVTLETGVWSRRLGGVRAAQQQQIQSAQPRIEIGSTGGNPTPREQRQVPTAPTGQRFGYSDEMIEQRAQELRNRRVS